MGGAVPGEELRRLRVFIFDLDGTLVDSRLDLANAVNATRAWLQLPPISPDEIANYVGQGAPTLVRRALGDAVTEDIIEGALNQFLGYYREHMLDNTVAYPGVREGLEQLAGSGRVLTVLTNKPANFSRAILRGLGLESFFTAVYGGNSFERKKPDPMGVEAILREAQATKEEAIIVGDSEIDVLAARNAGVRVCGVTYGLGSHRLRDFPPDLLVDSLSELAARVCG